MCLLLTDSLMYNQLIYFSHFILAVSTNSSFTCTKSFIFWFKLRSVFPSGSSATTFTIYTFSGDQRQFLIRDLVLIKITQCILHFHLNSNLIRTEQTVWLEKPVEIADGFSVREMSKRCYLICKNEMQSKSLKVCKLFARVFYKKAKQSASLTFITCF